MSIDTLVHLGIILCIFTYWVIYVRGIFLGKVKPVLATWMFLSLAVLISLASEFFQTGIQGVSANFFNLIDSLAVVSIFIIILFHKDTRRTFTTFEKGCILGVILICLIWFFTKNNIFTHLATQLILVIAYLPTLVELWNTRKNTEALGTWVFDCLGSLLGLIIPIREGQILPIVYGVRSVVSTLLVVLLILKIQYKQHDTRN